MNTNIHHEFSYQSRELGAQIEDTLGEPPDHKSYARIIASLIGEYAKIAEINDVNLLSFALADHLSFNDPAGLLAQCKQYDEGDATKAIAMVSCADATAAKALATVAANNPELVRKSIITAFLFKNPKLWVDADNSLDALHQDEQENEKGVNEEDESHFVPGQDFVDIFDTREDGNG
jgi:hypothetical protein